MNKLITFVVPCYNSQDYLEKCINSLLPAEELSEILIVNDGSTDKTGVIADDYAKKFPSIVRVLNQENSGHGEGINHGVRKATGKYFKVVDSDDWLDSHALSRVLRCLQACDERGGVDMMVTNYVYTHENKVMDKVIDYRSALPQNKIFGWDDTSRFHAWQHLTLHSTIYRTQILKEKGIELPKHVFYEDNLYVYQPLPYVEKIYYLDCDLYRYWVGRAGQSVSRELLKKRYPDQILVAKLIFKCHDIAKLEESNPKLAAYMYRSAAFMLVLASLFPRLARTDEGERQRIEMWNELKEYNPTMYKKIRSYYMTTMVNRPGKVGRGIALFWYQFAHIFFPFN